MTTAAGEPHPPAASPPAPAAAGHPRYAALFPTLSPAQLGRLAAAGRRRQVRTGEVLVEIGDTAVSLFAVLAGEIEILRSFAGAETLVVVHGPGSFTGEVNMLVGRPAFVRAVVRAAGEVVELDRDRLLSLVQTDAELSDVLLRAFILRRVELIAHGLGNVALLAVNIFAIPLFVQLIKMPYRILAPAVILICTMGTYSVNGSIVETVLMLAAGVFGFFMRLYGFSPAALVLALVLGPLAEQSLRQSLTISRGSFAIFVERPTSLWIVAFIAAILVLAFLMRRRPRPAP